MTSNYDRLNDNSTDFRRTISLHASPGRVAGELVDNVHHFRVLVQHDEAVVTAVTAEPIRVPWMTCPGAADRLSALVGTPVAKRGGHRIDQSQQCTHMLDLARLAIAHVSRGGVRELDVAIHFDRERAAAVATLAVNGVQTVEWLTRNGIVVSDGPYHGHSTLGRSVWSPEVEADDELREAGLVLRRAVLVFRSRNYSAPKMWATEVSGMVGVCYSFQPEHAHAAVRPPGFQDRP